MSEALADLSVAAFGDALASERPVPGGGSASAQAAAMAAGLAAMVARLASRKAPGTHDEHIAEMDGLRDELVRLVDEDAAAFAGVSAALGLPKGSDAEKAARSARLQSALLDAAGAPLRVAHAARRVLAACERATEIAPAAAASDVGVAALMAHGGLRGAALNVMINLASVRDAARVKALSEELDRALDGADEQCRRILDSVEARIAR